MLGRLMFLIFFSFFVLLKSFLGLSNNFFTGTIPTEIGYLSQLVHLALASNQFSGPIPTQIGKLTLYMNFEPHPTILKVFLPKLAHVQN
jgi:hypothetical protein